MSKYHILRINPHCERGVDHSKCNGYDERRVGRRFRCQCACHKPQLTEGKPAS